MPTNISGRVTDQHGQPVPEAVVMIISGPGSFPEIAAMTDNAGNFGLPPVNQAGNYVIRVQKDLNQIEQEVSLGPDAGNLYLTL